MARVREIFVNREVTSSYPGRFRCVEWAFPCVGQNGPRNEWIEDALKELATWFAIDGVGFSVMDKFRQPNV